MDKPSGRSLLRITGPNRKFHILRRHLAGHQDPDILLVCHSDHSAFGTCSLITVAAAVSKVAVIPAAKALDMGLQWAKRSPEGDRHQRIRLDAAPLVSQQELLRRSAKAHYLAWRFKPDDPTGPLSATSLAIPRAVVLWSC